MQSRYAFGSVAVILTGLIVYLSLQNWVSIVVSGLGTAVSLPLGSMLLLAFVAGIASTASVWLIRVRRQIRSEQKLQTWATQDAKLLDEIAADKVKLLEAKIATLEVALKSALKKKQNDG